MSSIFSSDLKLSADFAQIHKLLPQIKKGERGGIYLSVDAACTHGQTCDMAFVNNIKAI